MSNRENALRLIKAQAAQRGILLSDDEASNLLDGMIAKTEQDFIHGTENKGAVCTNSTVLTYSNQ